MMPLDNRITEAEAKEMLCPIMTRQPMDQELSVKCWGSGCMAWRWCGADITFMPGGGRRVTEGPKGLGFCGMAGN